MSIWLEIHCDAKLPSVPGEYRPGCYGENGQQPGRMARIASRVQKVLRGLSQEAMRDGWTLVAGKWTCPRCNRIKAQQQGGRTDG